MQSTPLFGAVQDGVKRGEVMVRFSIHQWEGPQHGSTCTFTMYMTFVVDCGR